MSLGTRVAAFYLVTKVAGCGETPVEYCPVEEPPPAPVAGALGGGLDGFDSPYLGHTGSWDGKGGGIGGSSKGPDMDVEVSMGLRWTFMPVYWRVMEPDGPVDLTLSLQSPVYCERNCWRTRGLRPRSSLRRVKHPPQSSLRARSRFLSALPLSSRPANAAIGLTQNLPKEWQELDTFVREAHARGLNILMQAPVMGGNAGTPPDWVSLREEGKSAPVDMLTAANFASRLAERYRPGGTLATQQGWGHSYGVRAWELDNEPNSYKVHWEGQEGDYAEFVTQVSAAIRAADPEAVILAPAQSAHGTEWTTRSLDPYGMWGSPPYQAAGIPYSLGPDTDVVSLHVYEGLDNDSINCVFSEVKSAFDAAELVRGFEYPRKVEYWHTEGNYDFFGGTDEILRANWRWQFMARAFAAGVHKINVMDVSEAERVAVGTFVEYLPQPFPMLTGPMVVLEGSARGFYHPEGQQPSDGAVWILWAENEGSGAVVEIPVYRESVILVAVDGHTQDVPTPGGILALTLDASELSPPVMVIDRP